MSQLVARPIKLPPPITSFVPLLLLVSALERAPLQLIYSLPRLKRMGAKHRVVRMALLSTWKHPASLLCTSALLHRIRVLLAEELLAALDLRVRDLVVVVTPRREVTTEIGSVIANMVKTTVTIDRTAPNPPPTHPPSHLGTPTSMNPPHYPPINK